MKKEFKENMKKVGRTIEKIGYFLFASLFAMAITYGMDVLLGGIDDKLISRLLVFVPSYIVFYMLYNRLTAKKGETKES